VTTKADLIWVPRGNVLIKRKKKSNIIEERFQKIDQKFEIIGQGLEIKIMVCG